MVDNNIHKTLLSFQSLDSTSHLPPFSRAFPYVFWRTRSMVNTYSSMNVAFIFWADMQPEDSAPQDSAPTFQVEAAPSTCTSLCLGSDCRSQKHLKETENPPYFIHYLIKWGWGLAPPPQQHPFQPERRWWFFHLLCLDVPQKTAVSRL